MSDTSTVLLDKAGAVAVVTLNRPAVINAFNVQMRDDLYSTLEAVRDDPDVRSILITGAGDRGFCAGADLTEFGTAPSQTVARQVRWERDLWGPVPIDLKAIDGSAPRLCDRFWCRNRLSVRHPYSLGELGVQNARGCARNGAGCGRKPDAAKDHRLGCVDEDAACQ